MNKIYLLIVLIISSITVNGQWANAILDSLTNNNMRDEVRKQSITVDNSNTIHVTYIRARAAGGWIVYYRQKPHYQPWSNEVMVSDTNAAAFRPAIAVNKATGTPYITYAQDLGLGMDIYLASSTGSGWSSLNVSANNTDDELPSIAIDGNAKIHLAWIGLDSLGIYRIFYSTDYSGNWDTQILTNSNLGQFGSGAEPSIATTSNGTAHIIYRGGGFSNYNIDHAYNASPGSNSWLHDNIITPNTEDYIGVLTIGPDSIINVAITGSGGFGFPNDVYYLFKAPGSQWSFPVQINSNFNGEAYSIFLDTVGFVHISILETSGNFYSGNVYYASDLQGGGGWLVSPLLTSGDIYNASIILDNLNYGWLLAFQGGSTFESQEIITFRTPDSLTSVYSILSSGNVIIYPNPANDFIKIKLKEKNNKISDLKIMDIRGKIIKEIKHDSLQEEIIISTMEFSAGIYLLQLILNDAVVSTKFLIDR